MSIEVSDLIAATDGDAEALEKVQPFINDPSNLGSVLELIFQPDSLANSKLFFSLSAVIKKYFDAILQNEPVTAELLPIVQNFLEFLASPQNTALNTAELEYIPALCLKFCDEDFFKWVIEQYQTIFTPEANTRLTRAGINIASAIAESGKLTPTENKNAACEVASPFFAAKLEQLKTNFDPQIVTAIAASFNKFGKDALAPLDGEAVHAIYVMLLEFFNLQTTVTENVIKMKAEISNFFIGATSNFCKETVQQPDFAQFFQAEILPNLMQVVIEAFPFFIENRSSLNDMVLTNLIFLANKFASLNQEQFYSPDFIAQVILPAAVLSNDQIVGYFHNPALYLAFELADDASKPDNTAGVRSAIYFYVRTTRKLFDYNQVAPTAEITDVYDIEARVFIFICCYKPRTETEKIGLIPKEIGNSFLEIINGLDLESIITLDVEENLANIEMRITEMREELGTFCLVPTIINALRKSKSSSASLRDIAYQVFANSHPSNIVLKATSLNLLYTALALCYDIGEIPLDELITHIIEFVQSPIKISTAADFLGFLIENFDVAESYGKELLTPLISDWKELLSTFSTDDPDADDGEASQSWEETLENINLILSTLNDEALKELAPAVIQEASEILEEFGDQASPFITVVSSLAMRLTTLPAEFGAFFEFLIQYIGTVLEAGQLIMFKPIADFIVPVITKLPGFAENEEYVKSVIDYCTSIGSNEELFPTDKATVFPIIAALITKHPQNAGELLELASQIYSGQAEASLSIIYAMTYTAVAALSVSNGELLSAIPEDLITRWMTNTYDPEREEMPCKLHPNAPITLRDRKFLAIGLLYIAKTGNEDALKNAFYLVERIMRTMAHNIRIKELEAQEKEALKEGCEEDVADDDEDAAMNEEEEEDDGEMEQLEDDYFISDDALLTIDSINVLALYAETVNALGAQESQPEGFLEKVIEMSRK